MSLIEEALRRVQDPQAPKTAPPAPPKPAAAPKKPEEPQAHPWPLTTAASATVPRQPKAAAHKSLMPLVAVMVGLAIGGWLAGVAWLSSNPRTSRSLRSAAPPSAAAPPSTAVSTAIAAPEAPALTGVVVGSGEPYAVIDGRIVGIGEQVGDGTVEQIVPRRVTLRLANGQERVLQVPR